MKVKQYTVLDIGGTSVKAAVMNIKGEILSEEKIPTPEQGSGEIYDLIREIVGRNRVEYSNISGLALSIPASVDVETSHVSFAGAVTDFVGTKVKEELADLDLPIEVENDANCAALAERWQGNATDTDSFLCVTVGTGIGGAIHLENGILHGQDGMGGEFGLMLLSHQGDIEDLFATETFSRLSSTWNIVNYLNYFFDTKRTGEEWFSLADEGDKEVKRIIERFYYQMSIGVINLMHIFAPDKILIGGGISEREDLIQAVRKHVAKVPTPMATKVKIEACKFKNQAGSIGALYHFLKRHGEV